MKCPDKDTGTCQDKEIYKEGLTCCIITSGIAIVWKVRPRCELTKNNDQRPLGTKSDQRKYK